MKTNYLLSLSTFIIATFALTSVSQKSVIGSDSIFYCQSNQETPTTIAKNKNGEAKPIFHWKLDGIKTSAKPKQLCDSVTKKLNNYHQDGNNLSSLIFKASTVIDDKNSTTVPAICIAGTEQSCKLSLFTLLPSENPQVAASNALDSILDQDLQASPVKSPTRGVQSTAYEVDLWHLFGF